MSMRKRAQAVVSTIRAHPENDRTRPIPLGRNIHAVRGKEQREREKKRAGIGQNSISESQGKKKHVRAERGEGVGEIKQNKKERYILMKKKSNCTIFGALRFPRIESRTVVCFTSHTSIAPYSFLFLVLYSIYEVSSIPISKGAFVLRRFPS